MTLRLMACGMAVMIAIGGFGGLVRLHPAAGAMTKTVTFLNVELDGSRIWLPGVLVLKRGEEVTVKLINKHKDPHGFAIDELKVQVIVDGASTKDVTLKSARTGTFRLYCHLHPAHVGGQIIVNP